MIWTVFHWNDNCVTMASQKPFGISWYSWGMHPQEMRRPSPFWIGIELTWVVGGGNVEKNVSSQLLIRNRYSIHLKEATHCSSRALCQFCILSLNTALFSCPILTSYSWTSVLNMRSALEESCGPTTSSTCAKVRLVKLCFSCRAISR